jgi:hypothetical protein
LQADELSMSNIMMMARILANRKHGVSEAEAADDHLIQSTVAFSPFVSHLHSYFTRSSPRISRESIPPLQRCHSVDRLRQSQNRDWAIIEYYPQRLQ